MIMGQTDDEKCQAWEKHKSLLMEKSLGTMHGIVMHSIIPFDVGGGLDLYYYPDALPGTAIATKELSPLPGVGSSNDVYSSYELVMFTRHPLDIDAANDPRTPFGRTHATLNAILNAMARFSQGATLNPGETCEFPADMDRIGGKCLIFDGYAKHSDSVAQDFGLLAIIEVFRSEMNYARKRGTAKLIERLKAKNVYPYSDLDRKPVVSWWSL
jgi:hypothetical protein